MRHLLKFTLGPGDDGAVSNEETTVTINDKTRIPLFGVLMVIPVLLSVFAWIFASVNSFSSRVDAATLKATEIEMRTNRLSDAVKDDRNSNKQALEKLLEKTTRTEAMVEFLYRQKSNK